MRSRGHLRRGVVFGRSEHAIRLAASAVTLVNAQFVLLAVARAPADLGWAPIAIGIGVLALAAFLHPVEPAPGEKFSVAAAAALFAAVVLPGALAVGAILAAALVAKLVQRRSAMNTVVNVAQAAGATASAALVIDASPVTGAGPTSAAALGYLVVTLGSVGLMIAASQGLGAARAFLAREALPTAALLGIGGVAGLAWTRDPLAILLFLPALVAIELAVRRPARARSATAAAEGDRGGTAVDAAHEIRTPLATLSSDLAYIQSSLPAREAEALASARTQAHRLSDLVDRLLMLGSVERGAGEATSADLALATERAIAPLTPHEHIDVEVDVPEGLATRIPADLLETAIRDLVANALAYARQGRVRIVARREGDRVAIRVADEGIGIPADELPHVFERFYRGSRAAQLAPGTGLGLSIVRRIVERHGGEIAIDSTVGRGTTVAVKLPLA